MVSLTVGKHFTILTFVDVSVVFGENNDIYEERLLEHISQNTKEESDQNEGSITVCSNISNCDEYFTCSIHKNLYLWKTKDWTLLSKRLITRSASAIVFSPKNDNIAIADKSGDVYLFSVDTPDNCGILILGHVSMLLDLFITPNGKYIVTSDRDEKIRISCYPNAYNIQSYCLGHEEFVTSISILPHDENILVSGGGDGTIRFWDFVCGKQLLCYCCSMNIDAVESNKPLIAEIVSTKCNEQKSLLCVRFVVFKGILIYCVSSNINKELNCVFKETIIVESIPLSIKYSCNHLWILLENVQETLSAYHYSTVRNDFSLDVSLNTINNHLKKHISLLENVFKKSRYPTTLYKRRFDNVQEYLKRKMIRIENETTKSKDQLSSSEIN